MPTTYDDSAAKLLAREAFMAGVASTEPETFYVKKAYDDFEGIWRMWHCASCGHRFHSKNDIGNTRVVDFTWSHITCAKETAV